MSNFKNLTASEKKLIHLIFAGVIIKDYILKDEPSAVNEASNKAVVSQYADAFENKMNELIGEGETEFWTDALSDIYKQAIKLLKKLPKKENIDEEQENG